MPRRKKTDEEEVYWVLEPFKKDLDTVCASWRDESWRVAKQLKDMSDKELREWLIANKLRDPNDLSELKKLMKKYRKVRDDAKKRQNLWGY